MGVFEMVAVVAVVAILADTITKWRKQAVRAQSLNSDDKARLRELAAQLDRMERRMENLETILLEEEKKREFERELT